MRMEVAYRANVYTLEVDIVSLWYIIIAKLHSHNVSTIDFRRLAAFYWKCCNMKMVAENHEFLFLGCCLP